MNNDNVLCKKVERLKKITLKDGINLLKEKWKISRIAYNIDSSDS